MASVNRWNQKVGMRSGTPTFLMLFFAGFDIVVRGDGRFCRAMHPLKLADVLSDQGQHMAVQGTAFLIRHKGQLPQHFLLNAD